MSNKVDKISADQRFWANSKHWAVYKLFKEGKSMIDIAESLKMRPYWVEETVSSPFFIKKLQHFLSAELFNYQAGRVVAVNDVFNQLWDRVRNNIGDIPAVDCLKELMKLLPARSENLKIQNPKQYNLLMLFDGKDKDGDSDKLKDVAKAFGYQGLKEEEINNEIPKIHSQLDSGESVEDEQSSAD